MNSFSEAVKLAISAGWSDRLYRVDTGNTEVWTHSADLVLNPLFWIALGKALNWSDKKFYQADAAHPHIGEEMPEAKWYFRSFMELKWNGGNEEQFFNELLKGKV